MNKNLYVLLFGVLCISLLAPMGSSYFTKTHEYWTIKGMQDIDSSITQQCRPYLQEVVDGNTLADVFVLGYFDTNGGGQKSYVSTHQLTAGYKTCLEEAGSDLKKRCTCYGLGTHIIQDFFSHTSEGVVPKYLSKGIGGLNFIGHMTIENDFQNKFLEYKSTDPIVSDGTLEFYDGQALDSLTPEFNGGDRFAVELLDDISGIPSENTLRVFRSGYQGEGFYNSVYKDKVKLPFWSQAVGWGLFLIGLILSIIFFITGKTRWKWVLILMWFAIAMIGLIIGISFIQGTTWQLTTKFIEVPAAVGYLSVDQPDIKYFDDKVQTATNEFLESGELPFEDASGLTYYTKEGLEIEGALLHAEGKFKKFVLPVVVVMFLGINFFFIRKSYKKKKGIINQLKEVTKK